MYAWEQIQKTVDYIEAHLNENLTMETLAKQAALSPFYFQRLFGRLVKKPVMEYIRLRRMAVAAETLLQQDNRILDIAVDLGFSSHEHFTRTFKDTFGITPEEYRRNPVTMNRMTKPELSLHYTLIDENVPLITDGITLEIGRRQLAEPALFVGFDVRMPVQFVEGLGTESGEDPLGALWDRLHAEKTKIPGLLPDGDELGVALPSEKETAFCYFAGAQAGGADVPAGYKSWTLPQGEYVVCTFEAENFEALVTDALYKAQQYLYSVWMQNHGLRSKPFCAERYASHDMNATQMEIWVMLESPEAP